MVIEWEVGEQAYEMMSYRAFCLAKTGVRTASKSTTTMLVKTKTWTKRRHSMHYKLSTFSLLLSHKAGKEVEILACVAADKIHQ